MHIQVKGKHIDVGDALTAHVEMQLAASVSKYFDRPIDAVVTFSRDRHAFRCDASVHLATGLTAQSSATASDVYAAFDQGADRIEKQLRRYKRRLKDHHVRRRSPAAAIPAQTYVIESSPVGDEESEPDSLQPVIIAESTTEMHALSVGEAVMQMELADRSFLMFRNDANGRFNLVFRRDDGHVGWVDPAATADA